MAEVSKVPWFIAGGVLALYAVTLAWIGLKRPDFPYDARRSRAVMALSGVLAAVAVAMAIITA
jgi:hypothetical protein